jgi:hypothetical protein
LNGEGFRRLGKGTTQFEDADRELLGLVPELIRLF